MATATPGQQDAIFLPPLRTFLVIVKELERERERNDGGVSKREQMVKTWSKRVVKVIVGI